jgi:hypothetical protein
MSADILYIKNTLIDVMLIADHFVMVTTIEMPYHSTEDEIETEAWDRLTIQYGKEWADMTREIIKRVSIEAVHQPTVNDIIKSLEEEANEEY